MYNVSQIKTKEFEFIFVLTYWGRVTHICANHWSRQWLVAWTAPTHYLNQCWNIVNWTLGNKLQWNSNRNSNIFIKKMHLKMSSGKSRPFCLGLNVLMMLLAWLLLSFFSSLCCAQVDENWINANVAQHILRNEAIKNSNSYSYEPWKPSAAHSWLLLILLLRLCQQRKSD